MLRTEHVMGMPVRVDVRAAADPSVLDHVFALLRDVDARFSPFRAGSAVARRARGEAAPDAALDAVLARCEALRMRTGGYFDARAGGRLDPSGLVKGWAVDRAAALLDAAGVVRWCVDAGGDVRVRGGGWRIGVRHPDDPLLLAGVLVLDDGAVATSGAYERGPHVIDPHSGRPPEGVRSVTVVGSRLATADAYATAAFAMGRRGPAWTARQRGHDAMTILDGDRVLATPGFLARCPGGSPAASLRRARGGPHSLHLTME
ncbi:MAG TPA: FAD:protein FMN transferase [Solirubrobacteraceae bacterium]|nr:FAD:protein FMN transferase [Solirubrobacteraceae bacterium]